MASEGPNSPDTMADDSAIGTRIWVNVDNVKSQDDTYAAGPFGPAGNPNDLLDEEVKIVKSDGAIGGENKANVVAWQNGDDDTYISYGGSSDLWSETWSPSDINDIDFGVVTSVDTVEEVSHYLKATNFGFSIPENATIDGIIVEIDRFFDLGAQGRAFAKVDHIRITVYYTEAGLGKTIQGISSITGVQSITL